MLTQTEIAAAIEELNNAKHTIQNCEKLAALYTVNDHLYPERNSEGYSEQSEQMRKAKVMEQIEYTVDDYGNTEFLKKINGKDAMKMWLLMDEVMETLAVLNPRLYDSIIQKI